MVAGVGNSRQHPSGWVVRGCDCSHCFTATWWKFAAVVFLVDSFDLFGDRSDDSDLVRLIASVFDRSLLSLLSRRSRLWLFIGIYRFG